MEVSTSSTEGAVTPKLGPVFYTGDLARCLGWTVQKTRRMLIRIGLCMRQGPSKRSRIMLTYADLIEHAPELYHSLVLRGAIDTGGD